MVAAALTQGAEPACFSGEISVMVRAMKTVICNICGVIIR